MVAQKCSIWGNLDSGFGNNYVAITGPGTFIKQTMSYLTPGELYEINFLAASRPSIPNGRQYTGEKLKVVIDGVDVFPSMLLPEIGFQRYRARFVHMPEYVPSTTTSPIHFVYFLGYLEDTAEVHLRLVAPISGLSSREQATLPLLFHLC